MKCNNASHAHLHVLISIVILACYATETVSAPKELGKLYDVATVWAVQSQNKKWGLEVAGNGLACVSQRLDLVCGLSWLTDVGRGNRVEYATVPSPVGPFTRTGVGRVPLAVTCRKETDK